jgi:hypothetical protein
LQPLSVHARSVRSHGPLRSMKFIKFSMMEKSANPACRWPRCCGDGPALRVQQGQTEEMIVLAGQLLNTTP